MNKKNFITFLCVVYSLIILLCPVSTMSVQAADLSHQTVDSDSSTIEPRAPITGWIFKEENGKRYRRLYNYTDEVWIGDWILCD